MNTHISIEIFSELFSHGSNNRIEFANALFSIPIFQIGIEETECRQPRRNRKRDLLKRVMASSHHRSNTVEADNSSERNSPVKSTVSEIFSLK